MGPRAMRRGLIVVAALAVGAARAGEGARLEVEARAGAASAVEVERWVTVPLEEALAGRARGLREVEGTGVGLREGVPVRVRDLARVSLATAPRECMAAREGALDVVLGEVLTRGGATPAFERARELLPPGMTVRSFGARPGGTLLRVNVTPPGALPLDEGWRLGARLAETLGALPVADGVVVRAGR